VNKNTIEYDGKFVAYLNSIDGCRIANYWNGLYKENEELKQSNENAWNLIQFIYNEIKEDGSMDFGRIRDLVELE
jgi:hypothetical protein